LRAEREEQANDDTDEEPNVVEQTFATQEPDSPPPTQDFLPEPTSSGRPARKPKGKLVEIPATQDARPSKPSRQIRKKPTTSSQRVRTTTKSPRGKHRLSKEIIVDSSDEGPGTEEEDEPVEEKTKLFIESDKETDATDAESDHETDNDENTTPSEKPEKQYNPKHPRRASRNGPGTLNQGKFSVEEDERIHAFAAQYKQVSPN
jgi:hypothetical protein